MGYFHALKWAFLSSLIRKYMLWEGFYHDFSTKKVSGSGGSPPDPHQGAPPPDHEVTSPPLTIYPGAAPAHRSKCTVSLNSNFTILKNLKLFLISYYPLHLISHHFSMEFNVLILSYGNKLLKTKDRLCNCKIRFSSHTSVFIWHTHRRRQDQPLKVVALVWSSKTKNNSVVVL